MDGSLFNKYSVTINKNKKEKETCISCIKEATGIVLETNEITIQNKKVTITTSSAKKAVLLARGCKKALTALGYSL